MVLRYILRYWVTNVLQATNHATSVPMPRPRPEVHNAPPGMITDRTEIDHSKLAYASPIYPRSVHVIGLGGYRISF